MPEKKQGQYLQPIIFWLFAIFLISIVFSLRAVSSISIGLLLIGGAIEMKTNGNGFLSKNPLFFFSIACITLYFLKIISLAYTENQNETIKHLQKTSALIFVPLAVYTCKNCITAISFNKLMTYLTIAMFFAGMFCIGFATGKYLKGSVDNVFFYHELVRPLSQHAIQMSILVFITLVFSLESLRHGFFINKALIIGITVFLSLFLFLLSSKLIIVFYVLYLVYYSLSTIRRDKVRRLYQLLLVFIPLLAIILILATSNPVGNRFKELTSGNMELFRQEKFHDSVYFNGLQFRLLQWRFVYEILNENHKWLIGLSPGDAQHYLDQKYIATNMYTGKPGTTETGFIGYHTHNQFLQVILQSGLAGLFAFLSMCFVLLRLMIIRRNWLLGFTISLLLIYCFTDAILETQYGLILFTFFPVFIFCGVSGWKDSK
ncbi:MAG: O-antigen ligase family protein [Flavisolibacter sp.]